MPGCSIDDAAVSPSFGTDWESWHRAYEDPLSSISRRLVLVRRALAAALDAMPPGSIPLLSVCAGDGRDVIGVLERHPRAPDVAATLVDLHPGLVGAARAAAADRGLDQVRVFVGDAGRATWYEATRPIGILVACGVFGNISSNDLRVTIRAFGGVVAHGGFVVWTRHRRQPDQTPLIRRWFTESGFDETSFETVDGSLASVGCHRRAVRAVASELPERLFEFVGDGRAAHL
jgi:putative methyltransferase